MSSDASVGKARRWSRLFGKARSVIVPIDDSLIAGPEAGLQNLDAVIRSIGDSGADAILCFKGGAHRVAAYSHTMPIIMNLTASTTRSAHTAKHLIAHVEDALKLNAEAVACHINLTSPTEGDMIAACGRISSECNNVGMPLLAIVYPRTVGNNGADHNYEDARRDRPNEYTALVRHCVRLAEELGADAIKTVLVPDAESMASVVACSTKPIIVAGGPMLTFDEALRRAKLALSAGVAGISFGRNVFGRENPGEMVRALQNLCEQAVQA